MEMDDKEKQNAEYTMPIKTPDWWNDLYVDVNGNCFSDADNGL